MGLVEKDFAKSSRGDMPCFVGIQTIVFSPREPLFVIHAYQTALQLQKIVGA